jgi:CRP/FNR family transcriptional regulator
MISELQIYLLFLKNTPGIRQENRIISISRFANPPPICILRNLTIPIFVSLTYLFMANSLKEIFPNFSRDLLQTIGEKGIVQDFKSGTVLIRPGQYIQHTLLILEGQIKIYRQGEDGGEFLMYYIQPGQACAISMICSAKSEQSQVMAKVVEDASVILIPLHLMDKWMMEHRSWYEFVIATYRNRFEEVLEVVDNIAFRSMDERLEFYLKRHAEACGCPQIKLSHQEIATELNTSREVISRLLKKMEQRGLVKLNRNQIELLQTNFTN